MAKIKRNAALLLIALVSSSCATPGDKIPPAPPQDRPAIKAKLPPPSPEVMVERPATFQQRLVNFFSASPAKPTK